MNAHVDEHLLALIERRLTAAERARVAIHLEACPRCRASARALAETADELAALPNALRALPLRAARQWPAVWAKVRAAGSAARSGPQLSVYLGLVSSLVAIVAVIPSVRQGAPASVTAGVAAGPQLTQPATVVMQVEGTVAEWQDRASDPAAPTVDNAAAIAPVPIPTPAP